MKAKTAKKVSSTKPPKLRPMTKKERRIKRTMEEAILYTARLKPEEREEALAKVRSEAMKVLRQELRNEGFSVVREWHPPNQPEQEAWSDGKRFVLLDDGKRRNITVAELFEWWEPMWNNEVNVGQEPQGEQNFLTYMRNSVVIPLTGKSGAAIRLCAERFADGDVHKYVQGQLDVCIKSDVEEIAHELRNGEIVHSSEPIAKRGDLVIGFKALQAKLAKLAINMSLKELKAWRKSGRIPSLPPLDKGGEPMFLMSDVIRGIGDVTFRLEPAKGKAKP